MTSHFYFEPNPFNDGRWLIATSDDAGKVTLTKVRDLPTSTEVGGWQAHALMKAAMSALEVFDPRSGSVPQGFENLIEREEDVLSEEVRGG